MTPLLPHRDDAELDRMLFAYFQRDVPSPWPVCRATTVPSEVRGRYADTVPRSPAANRSQLALAASVAALLGLGLFVSSGPRPEPAVVKRAKPAGTMGLLEKSTADGTRLVTPPTK
ncbi:MAG: hypothetical protein ACRC7O_08790 [Fimbriiglobus sp.]